MSFAVLIHTNDRTYGQNKYVGNLRGDTIEELGNKLVEKYPESEPVAAWMQDHEQTILSALSMYPQDTFFCGDSGEYRYDVQTVD